MRRVQRTKNRKINKARYVIIALCLAVFFYSSYHVASNFIKASKSQQMTDKEAERIQAQIEEAMRQAQEAAQQNAQNAQNQGGETSESSEGSGDGTGSDSAVYVPLVLNFDGLKATNPDIMGWLQVDATNINYPVLYSETDRSFYLTHNYVGAYDPQGSIFIENFNSKSMGDFNTVVYGHSMLNGNMFGTLHNYSHWDIFQNYGGVTFYTPSATYHYYIFETATIPDDHIFTYLDNSSYDSIQSYISRLNGYSNGFKRDGIYITPEDRILTLSTCTTDDSYRLVVFAVLTSVDTL